MAVLRKTGESQYEVLAGGQTVGQCGTCTAAGQHRQGARPTMVSQESEASSRTRRVDSPIHQGTAFLESDLFGFFH